MWQNYYKKCAADSYSFLINNTTLSSDDPLQFRKFILEKIYDKSIQLIKILKNEQLQFNVNGEVIKISALLSGKSDK